MNRSVTDSVAENFILPFLRLIFPVHNELYWKAALTMLLCTEEKSHFQLGSIMIHPSADESGGVSREDPAESAGSGRLWTVPGRRWTVPFTGPSLRIAHLGGSGLLICWVQWR